MSSAARRSRSSCVLLLALGACGPSTLPRAAASEPGSAGAGTTPQRTPAPTSSSEVDEGELSATLPDGCEAKCRGSANERLMQALQRDLPTPVRRCYETALKRDPRLAGTIRLGLQIDAQGRVCAVAMKSSMQDVELGRCIDRALRGQRLPPPEGGCVDVELPLKLVSSQPE